MYCPRGRVLGGSSSINGMIFVRGNAGDYERWANVHGLDDWSYEQCLPYFQRLESTTHGEDAYRGRDGPMSVHRGEGSNPLSQAWLRACEQAGYGLSADFNGISQEGGGHFDVTVARGRRFSTAKGYLAPIRGRQNLTVVTGARATRILFDGDRATGVEYFASSRKQEVLANAEVILCGGAINSPQLLLLSGIGPADDLTALGLPVLHDSPEVGANLQDHLEIYVQYACTQNVSLYPYLQWYRQPFVGLEWYLRNTGAGASNHFETGAFLRSGHDFGYPDLQFHFLPIAMNYDGSDKHNGHGFQVHVGPMKPKSRGSVSLKSSDPLAAPAIRFNYNQHPEDLQVMERGIKIARELVNQSAFDQFRGEPLGETDPAKFIKDRAESAYHPSCTCRMGVDSSAVVSSQGLVNGVQNLRVVDASIMPEITNGNLNAVVIMMAEKIAVQIG